MFLRSVLISVLLLSGCASLQSAPGQSRLVVQLATMKVIEADRDHTQARALAVKRLAGEAQRFFDTDHVTVGLLADSVAARLAGLDLSPSDRVLAIALVGTVVGELDARVGDGLLSADQKFTASQVLGWVEQTASLY